MANTFGLVYNNFNNYTIFFDQSIRQFSSYIFLKDRNLKSHIYLLSVNVGVVYYTPNKRQIEFQNIYIHSQTC